MYSCFFLSLAVHYRSETVSKVQMYRLWLIKNKRRIKAVYRIKLWFDEVAWFLTEIFHWAKKEKNKTRTRWPWMTIVSYSVPLFSFPDGAALCRITDTAYFKRTHIHTLKQHCPSHRPFTILPVWSKPILLKTWTTTVQLLHRCDDPSLTVSAPFF